MNKQSLYLFGGALLASTALTTASQAALVKTNPGSAAGDAKPATVAITAKGLATQVFSGTAATAGAVTISGTTGTAASDVLIDYSSAYNTAFNIQLDVTGAEFTGTPSIIHYFQSTSGGSLEVVTSVTGCTVQTLSDKILISNCDPSSSFTATSTSRVDAIAVRGLTYTSAGALATAGTSVTLSGVIRNSANTITFENITAAAVITSKSAVSATVDQSTALSVDNTASPAFTKLTGSVASAVIGSITYSNTAAVGTDLSTVLLASSLSSTTEVKVTHGVLSDAALTEIRYVTNGAATTTKTPGQFASGTVTFSVAGNSLAGATITVQFNGTTAISAATGTATVTPTAAAPTITATGAFSGSLASLTRGGLSIQLNTVLSSASSGYASYIRLVNNSTVSGTATVTVLNDELGSASALGTYTTASIPAGGTLTISSTDIETALGLTASATVNYKVTVAGSFNGYAQHLVYNTVSGVFSDFSGFRNGALTIDP